VGGMKRNLYLSALIATAVYSATFFLGVLVPQSAALGGVVTRAAPRFLDTWLHNVVSLAPLWLGALSFGALTMLWLAFQGLAHGFAVGHAGLPVALALAKIWRHGLLEIASILLAATFGLSPGVALFLENKVVWPKLTWLLGMLAWLSLLGLAAYLEGRGL